MSRRTARYGPQAGEGVPTWVDYLIMRGFHTGPKAPSFQQSRFFPDSDVTLQHTRT
jgi:hypothetical protein